MNYFQIIQAIEKMSKDSADSFKDEVKYLLFLKKKLKVLKRHFTHIEKITFHTANNEPFTVTSYKELVKFLTEEKNTSNIVKYSLSLKTTDSVYSSSKKGFRSCNSNITWNTLHIFLKQALGF